MRSETESSDRVRSESSDQSESGAETKKTLAKIYPIINTLIALIIIFALGYAGYKIYKLITFEPEITEKKIEIKENQALEKILKSTNFGTPVSDKEPTGRTDPFVPY